MYELLKREVADVLPYLTFLAWGTLKLDFSLESVFTAAINPPQKWPVLVAVMAALCQNSGMDTIIKTE